MKKQIISLIALFLCCAISAFAQSPLVATLSHNDTVSVFYGRLALKEAYDVSTHGDVITLSSGSFDVPSTISKNIAIRGAGMKRDSVNNVFPTILMGDFDVYTASSTGKLMMEGIYHEGEMTYGGVSHILKNAQFVKCSFGTVECKYGSGSSILLNDVVFVQCHIRQKIQMDRGNPRFMNCVIFEPQYYSTIMVADLTCEFFNSILVSPRDLWHSEFCNCVLWGSRKLDYTNVAYQCVANFTGTEDGGMFDNIIGELGNVSLSDSTALFKTFRGTYSGTETFELTDTANEKYLGTDGTQVGIYGGTLPFSPQVTMPQIKKFKVAPKSTGDGKLSVEIEVGAAE